jgi:hypothetical protein
MWTTGGVVSSSMLFLYLWVSSGLCNSEWGAAPNNEQKHKEDIMESVVTQFNTVSECCLSSHCVSLFVSFLFVFIVRNHLLSHVL